jgi:hypothetical protein
MVMLIFSLRVLGLDESKVCGCGSEQISRWIDKYNRHYCGKCVAKVSFAWREVWTEEEVNEIFTLEELEAMG